MGFLACKIRFGLGWWWRADLTPFCSNASLSHKRGGRFFKQGIRLNLEGDLHKRMRFRAKHMKQCFYLFFNPFLYYYRYNYSTYLYD
jgi:hypothetical protein